MMHGLSRLAERTRGTLASPRGARVARTRPLRVAEGARSVRDAATLKQPAPAEHQQRHLLHDVSSVAPPGARSAEAALTPAEADAPLLFDFDASHVPRWTPGLALYAPLGAVLAGLRASLWVAGALLDAEWFRRPEVASLFLRLLGFRAHWQHLERLPPGRHIMVTNHATPGDLLALFEGLPQRYVHLVTPSMPARVTTCRNLPLLLKYATPEVLEQLGGTDPRAQGRAPGEPELPLHLHPEGGLTNGRWGMMQFSRGFTRMMRPGDWVVPVALRARTPWGIRTHTLLSSFPENFFWLSFCPWVEITATVLPPVQQQEQEPRGAFVKRVQQAIADELGVVVSECNIAVKKRIMQQEEAKRRKGKQG